MPLLRLSVLGGFQAEVDGRGAVAAAWRRPGAQALLKLLAVTRPSHRLTRDQLLDSLWPGTERPAARNRLRVVLHEARHALEPDLPPRTPSTYLLADGDALLLCPRTVRVDLDQAVATAGAALDQDGPEMLRASADALAATVLPDEHAPWADAVREELRELRGRLLGALTVRLRETGAHGQAVRLLTEELAAEPTAEDLHRLLMQLHLSAGRPELALRQFQSCRDALLRELDVTPDPQTAELAERARAAVAAGGRTTARTLPGPLRTPPPWPLVGRGHALTLLRGKDHAPPPLLVVTGEAGVGKTRLVADAARAEAASGTAVLWGASHEAEGSRPYGPFAEAIEGRLADLPPADRNGLVTDLPALGGLLAAVPQDTGRYPARTVLFAAVSELLDRLASGRRLLVVCDDLHAADEETLHLLHHLVRTAAGRWRFLATARDDHPGARGELGRLLAGLGRARLLQRVTLMRLAADDTDRLVASLLGPEQAEHLGPHIHALSRGNPLLAAELADAYRESGELPVVDPLVGDVSVPERVHDLATDRLARLPEPVRRVVAVLACAPAETPVTELLDIAGAAFDPPMSEPGLLDALEAAQRAGLLEEREVVVAGRPAPGYAFRHPVVRLACYQGLSAARRRLLHREHATALARHRPDRLDDLVVHQIRAGDDAAAVPTLRKAARRAADLFAHAQAERYYRELVRRLDGRAEPAGADRLRWGTVLRHLARYAEAEQVLTVAAEEPAGGGGSDEFARAVVELAEVRGRVGAPRAGLELLERLGDPLQGLSDAVCAAVWLSRARMSFMSGRYDYHHRAAEQAAAIGLRLPDPVGRARVVAEAQVARSIALLCAERYAESAEAATTAVPLAESVGDLATVSTAVSNLGELAEIAGRLELALQYRRRGRDLAVRIGEPSALTVSLAEVARLHLLTGNVDRAVRQAREAEDAARVLGDTWCLVYPLLVLGEAQLRAGRFAEARSHLRESAVLAGQLGDLQAARAAAVLQAELAVAEGRLEEAPALLDEAEADPQSAASRITGPNRRRLQVTRAAALLASGDGASAAVLAADCTGAAAAAGDRLTEADGRLVLGRALRSLGQHAAAERELRLAADLARTTGYHPGLPAVLSAGAAVRAAFAGREPR